MFCVASYTFSLCSIIMPCYNREHYIKGALEAIKAQVYTNWELIIVDDGSTDNTRNVVMELTQDIDQPVVYINQENSGAYSARQNGVEKANGEFIAFYDSDDLWLSHHLEQGINELKKNEDVDWFFGPCQRVEYNTGIIRINNHLYDEKPSQKIMQLNTQNRNNLKVIDDEQFVATLLETGWGIGLQHSILRRRIFAQNFFWTDLKNGEDRFFLIRAIKKGAVVGYVDNIQTIYRIHNNNSSSVNSSYDPEKLYEVHKSIALGYERIKDNENLNNVEYKNLKKRLAHEYFWMIGYNSLLQLNRYKEAQEMFVVGLKYYPFDIYMWKTFLLIYLKRFIKKLKLCI